MAEALVVHSARNPATRNGSFPIASSVVEIMEEVSRFQPHSLRVGSWQQAAGPCGSNLSAKVACTILSTISVQAELRMCLACSDFSSRLVELNTPTGGNVTFRCWLLYDLASCTVD